MPVQAGRGERVVGTDYVGNAASVVEETSSGEGMGKIETVDDLFHLYHRLIQPLKNFEKLCDRQDTLKKEIQDAKDTVKSAFVLPFLLGLKFTFALAIPFVIVFLIVANVCHTQEGVSLFTAYDDWFTQTGFGVWLSDKVSGMIDSGLFVGFLGVILTFIVGCALFPIAVFLFPAMLAVGIVVTIFSVISARGTIKRGNRELPELEAQISRMLKELAEPLAYVPPDYRYSAAVEHFCQSYGNGKATSLKEAVNLFDTYVHQLEMEQRQQEILETHREVLRKLDVQSAQLKSLERQVKNVQSDVNWLYWR